MSPCPKRLGRLGTQPNIFRRSFRFRRTFHYRHYRSTDVPDEVFEIHILPLKPDEFSSAQPRESVQLGKNLKLFRWLERQWTSLPKLIPALTKRKVH